MKKSLLARFREYVADCFGPPLNLVIVSYGVSEINFSTGIWIRYGERPSGESFYSCRSIKRGRFSLSWLKRRRKQFEQEPVALDPLD